MTPHGCRETRWLILIFSPVGAHPPTILFLRAPLGQYTSAKGRLDIGAVIVPDATAQRSTDGGGIVETMLKKKLGNSDLELTPVGVGAWAMGGGNWAFSWGPQDDNESIEAIHTALDRGINWIDT